MLLLIYLKIHIIAEQKVKQTAPVPINEIKILGQCNSMESCFASESHFSFNKGKHTRHVIFIH